MNVHFSKLNINSNEATSETSSSKSRRSTKQQPIAIVGMSGRYPKADTLEKLWQNLKARLDAVSEAKGDRWDLGYHSPEKDLSHRVYTKSGGFLDRIDLFDAEFFGMSPREAMNVDPQHRLMLELTWEALESAGFKPSDLAGSKTGVFVGISSQDYAQLAKQEVNAYTNIGSALSIASNRISYIFDFHGPSMSIDTACSSSLVAMHQACVAVQSGECTMAVVGGVNILATIRPWIGFAEASMLSPDGRCKSFDADGKGYVRAEGGGVVLIKPLADAERDGDEILGVILATGVNSDGRTMGMALPSGEAQEALLREVYARSGVSIDDVFYVEAHGTGTAVGDPIECGALARVLGIPRKGKAPVHIGSIKSNIGHLESGAAIAGLTKLLLSIKHREIPANLHFNTPNPKIDFEGWKLKVVDKPVALPKRRKPLVFGINSFGFGGTNAHLVLQEYRPSRKVMAARRSASTAPARELWNDMLMLSARSQGALNETAARWASFLDGVSDADWADVRAAAALNRDQHAHRLVVAGSKQEIAARLADAAAGKPTPFSARLRAPAGARKLAFVFSGNGPQWWGMGRELLAENAVFRAKLEEIDAIFTPIAGWSLIAEMGKPESDVAIARTEIAQPLLFAQQVALMAVLANAGITASAAFGHSVGEVAAAHAAGALSLEDATRVIIHRSSQQARTAGLGRMAAVGLGPDDVAKEIAKIPGWLEIAAVNSPRSVTVAGDGTALETLRDRLTDEGHFVRLLALDYPFHTRAMDIIHDDVLKALADLTPQPATIPFLSTVTGKELAGEQLSAAYWWKNIREPVAFAAAVQAAMAEHAITDFLEIGPHPVLKDYVLQCAKAADNAAVAAHTTLRRPTQGRVVSDVEAVTSAICAVYAAGAASPRAIFEKPVRNVTLPFYAWQRERFWRGEVLVPHAAEITSREHLLLGSRADATDSTWTNTIQTMLVPYINDHVVQGARLFPAAGYIEMIVTAGLLALGEGAIECEGFEILRPLVVPDKGEPITQLALDRQDGMLFLRSRPVVDATEWTDHVRGRMTKVEVAAPPALDINALRAAMPVAVTGKAHYAGCDRRGLNYGPTFQGVTAVHLTAKDATQRMALGEIRLPWLADGGLDGYRAHPALLDSALQVLITLIGQNDPRDCATIPVQVARLRSYAPLVSEILCHTTLVSENARTGVANLTLTDLAGNVLVVLEGARFQKVEFRSTQLPMLGESWQIDPTWVPLAAAPIALPSASTLAETTTQVDAMPADVARSIEDLAAAYAVRALQSLGADQGGPFTAASLARKAETAEDQQPLLERLIALAADVGALKKVQGRWMWPAGQEAPDCEARFKALMLAYPRAVAELMALARAGNALVDRLKGEATTGIAMIESLEDTSPYRTPVNARVAGVVEKLVAAWPRNAALRVAEFNVGTGGLAAHVLPLLPVARADYLAIDRSEQALGRLRNRFAHVPVFRTASAQKAVTAGRFDLVLANIDAHADTPLSEALSEARTALVAGGVALIAVAKPSAFADITFGPRSEDASVDADGLAAAVMAAGFCASEIRIIDAGATHHIAIAKVAQDAATTNELPAIAAKARAIVISTAEVKTPTLESLVATLGATTTVHVLPERDQASEQAVLDLVRNMGPIEEIVHLAGWARSTPADAAAYDAMLDERVLSATLVGRAIETLGAEPNAGPAPVLTLVTRGAFAGPSVSGPTDATQAALAGLARVMANEQASLGARLVDLPAAPDDASAGVALAHALAARDAETEVSISNGQRWVNRARAASLAEQASASRFLPAMKTQQPRAEAFKLDFLPQGGLDSLHLAAIDRRAPGADEVEIRVKAAGLNFRDVLWAMGMLPEEAVEHGFSGPTIGMECAGEVIRVGRDVTHLAPGDRVIAFASSCFASHVTTKAGSVARIPAHLTFAEAATIPTVFVTAWYALDHLARLEPGETVLIHGAAGGVGLAALQIAKLKGAVVIGTAGSEDKQRLVRTMGADHVLSSRSLRFADDVLRLTDGKGVDVVLNSLAGEAITKGLSILKPFGRFLEIGKRDLYANSRVGLRPFRQNLSYFGIDADTLLVERPALAKRVFEAVVAAIASGELRPLPHLTTPITRAAEAFRAMQQSRHVGKLVVTIYDATVATAPVAPKHSSTVRPGVTYLVTGGLAGFGLSTAEWLVSQGATSLALLGRRGVSTDEARAAIARMQAHGAHVRGFACDVAEPAQVRDVLATVRREMAPLKGVIHAAALIEDAPLMKLDSGLLRRVHAAKVGGALILDKETRADDLEMFVLYSSSSALVGNPGQGAYVAANIVLDQLAEARRAQGLPALSVGWGAIKDAGFLTRNQHVEEILAQRAGMEATPVRDAFVALGQLLATGAVHVSAAQFNMMRLGQNLAGARTPRFLDLVPEHLLSAGQGANSIAAALEAMSEEERRGLLFNRIREHVGRVIGSAPDQIDPEKSLTEMGLDSLMAVELAEALEHDIGRPVSVMQMIQAGKINAIVDALLRSFRGKKAEADAPAAAQPQATAALVAA